MQYLHWLTHSFITINLLYFPPTLLQIVKIWMKLYFPRYIINRLKYEIQLKCWKLLWKIQAKNFNAEGSKSQQAFLGKILLL